MKQLENYTIMLQKISKCNTSGYTGVSWFKHGKKWRAVIKGKTIGYFESKEEAYNARQKAEQLFLKTRLTKNSSSGYGNIYKAGKTWTAKFYVENKIITISSFDNKEEANQVYFNLKNESYFVIDQYRRERKNKRRLANSPTGTFGLHKYKKKWVARVKKDNKWIYVGYFKNKQDAIKAQREAE